MAAHTIEKRERTRLRKQRRRTAAVLLSPGQIALKILLVLGTVAQIYFLGWYTTLKGLIIAITVFYVVFVGFKLLLWWAATRYKLPRTYHLPQLNNPLLPKYTVLVPLRGEANVVERLVSALSRLRYPAEKLEVLLLLEEYDKETQAAVGIINLPSYFRVLLVPDVGPQTKPKACNYGYMHATGDRVVIYDAEDRPEPDQLLKAVAAFRLAAVKDGRIACLQAVLSFWNPRSSWISSFYWAEYTVHFRMVLTGLAYLGLVPPLGGTSNHFKREALEAVAEANGAWRFVGKDGNPVVIRGPWDPFNITEDADLAFRLRKCGYRTDILQSITYEEAPEHVRRAKNQRGRWLQGYAQTGLVHTRAPIRSIRQTGLASFLSFNLLMLGTPFSLFINPLTWTTTALYVYSRVEMMTGVSTFMEGLFTGPTYYAGMLVAVGGNALLFYQKLIAPVQQQERSEALPNGAEHELGDHLHEQEYGLTTRLLFAPFWWMFTSISAYRAARRLLIPSQRSAWDKTTHGAAQHIEAALEQRLATGATPSSAALPRRGVENT